MRLQDQPGASGLQSTLLTPDGARVRLVEVGPAPRLATQTVILIHGWSLSHRSWWPVMRALSRDHPAVRLVAYDQRGHGRSTRGAAKTTIRTLGSDVRRILEAVGANGPVVLAGHSMGAMSIMAYAGEHPEHFTEHVRGTVLAGTACADLVPVGLPLESLLMPLCAHLPALPAGRLVTRRAVRRHLFGPRADPAAVSAVLAQVRATRIRTIGSFHRGFPAHDETGSLTTLGRRPAHLLAGALDRMTPLWQMERLGRQTPNARLSVVPGAGHMLTYEATDAVTNAIVGVLPPTPVGASSEATGRA